MDVSSRFGVAELLVVVNTRHGPGGHHGLRARPGDPMHDHLADPVEARRFIEDHHVAVPLGMPGADALVALRQIRRQVRALAGDDGRAYPDGHVSPEPTATPSDEPAAPSDEPAIRRLFHRYAVCLEPDGTLAPVNDRVGWDAFVADLLPPLVEVQGAEARLRMCANPLCRFLFLDRSRNASRVWCEMAVCGNRVRGSRHRLRHRAV